jgi:hypothetical protein
MNARLRLGSVLLAALTLPSCGGRFLPGPDCRVTKCRGDKVCALDKTAHWNCVSPPRPAPSPSPACIETPGLGTRSAGLLCEAGVGTGTVVERDFNCWSCVDWAPGNVCCLEWQWQTAPPADKSQK